LTLFKRDELHERALVRCLVEFGGKEWDSNQKVADYIFEEFLDQQLIEDPSLVEIMEQYRKWYKEGLEPTEKNFLYYEDQQMSALVVSLLAFPHELSPNWDKVYDGKVSKFGDYYKEDVLYSSNYLKLRKIKKMIEENHQDMNQLKNENDLMVAIQTHYHLKQLEKDLTSALGTVIYK
jgi:DNA primase